MCHNASSHFHIYSFICLREQSLPYSLSLENDAVTDEMIAHIHVHIYIHSFYGSLNFVWDYLGEPVPEQICGNY